MRTSSCGSGKWKECCLTGPSMPRFLWEGQEPADLTFRTALGVVLEKLHHLPRFTERVSRGAEMWILVSLAPKVMLFSLCQKVKQPQRIATSPGVSGRPGKGGASKRRWGEGRAGRENGHKERTSGDTLAWEECQAGSFFFLRSSYMGIFTL